MKTRTKLFHVIAMLLLLMSVFPAMGVAAKKKPPKPPKTDKKVYFCHRKGKGNGGFVLIHVSKNASKAHLKHGDAHPGEPVPGQEGKWFDNACKPVEPVRETVVFDQEPLAADTWAGVICPTNTTVVGGGYDGATLLVAESQAAKPGIAPYPTYPNDPLDDFVYVPPATGWVVQNGPAPQSLTIFADCLPASP